MSRTYFFLLPIVICIPVLVPSAAAAAGDLLTVAETVDLTNVGSRHGVPRATYNRIRRANPDARPVLAAMLDDEAMSARWPLALLVYGYVGKAEDVETLSRFIDRQQGLVVGQRLSSLQQALMSIGIMAGRGVKDATTLLEKMVIPSYWDAKKFSLSQNQPSGYPSESQNMALYAFDALRFSRDHRVIEIGDRLLRSVTAQGDRDVLKPWVEHCLSRKDYWDSGTLGVDGPEAPSSRPATRGAASMPATTQVGSSDFPKARIRPRPLLRRRPRSTRSPTPLRKGISMNWRCRLPTTTGR